MQRNGALITSIIMLVIFVFFVQQALGFNADARFLPLLVGVPALVLSACQVAIEWRKRRAQPQGEALFQPGERFTIVWLLMTVISVIVFGFSFGAPPMIAIYLAFIAKERPLTAVIGAVLCYGVLHYMFERLLNAQLFQGLYSTGYF